MAPTPLLSVVVATARGDDAFTDHPDWKTLDKIVECCDRQRFRDFELIVVDLLYEHRARYFEGVKLGFPLLHIPDKKGPFKDFKLTRICSARNTGIMYARGRFVVTGDDGEEWSPNSFERFEFWSKRRIGATGRLYQDKGTGVVSVDSRYAAYRIREPSGCGVVSAASAGYLGGTLTMTPASVMLRCNGFDEMFDGSRQLEDSDLAYRLGAAGLRVALDSSIRVVEYAQRGWAGDERLFRKVPHTKCNGAYFYPILFSARRNRVASNTRPLDQNEVRAFLVGNCPKLGQDGCCSVGKGPCLDGWKWGQSDDDLAFLTRVYGDERLAFDLEALRSARAWETVGGDPLLF